MCGKPSQQRCGPELMPGSSSAAASAEKSICQWPGTGEKVHAWRLHEEGGWIQTQLVPAMPMLPPHSTKHLPASSTALPAASPGTASGTGRTA